MDLKLVQIHPLNTIPVNKLGYVATVSRFNNKWIIVKLKNHQTREFPGGGIEQNETPIQAAKREMYEETGTVQAVYTEVGEYTAELNGLYSYGKIFSVEVTKLDKLPESEIELVEFVDDFPYDNTRYPNIQPQIFNFVENLLSKLK